MNRTNGTIYAKLDVRLDSRWSSNLHRGIKTTLLFTTMLEGHLQIEVYMQFDLKK